MKRLFIFLLALIALAALGWFAIYQLKAPAIQQDIQSRSQQALSANNITWASVKADGRDLTLTGVAPNEQLRQYALDTANVYGTRQVDDQIEVAITTPAASLSVDDQSQEADSPTVMTEPSTELNQTKPSTNSDLSGTAVSDAAVVVKTAKVSSRSIPYRMNIIRDNAGVYLFEGVVPNAEFKQAVDEHLTQIGADPSKARWNLSLSAEQAPANWQSNTLKSVTALNHLSEGSALMEGRNAIFAGRAATQDASDQAESVAQALVADFETMDVAFEVSRAEQVTNEVSATPMVGSAKYAEKFCQAEFNRLLKQEKIQFETGSAALEKNSIELLKKVVQVTSRCPDHQIQVHGYTDSKGSAAINKKLSKARAESVMAYLNELGLDPQRLVAIGHGEAKPIASNNTEKGRAKNRRIELIVKGLKK